jgi:hypothetical protein
MSRGLGTIQRLMLFRLATHEVRVAEAAAQRQRPYRSPDRWSLAELLYSLSNGDLHERAIAPQRRRHAFQRALLEGCKNGNKFATEMIKLQANIAASVHKPGPNLDPEEFQPEWPDYRDLERFNPSRAIRGLAERGMVHRDGYRRMNGLALTREGFSEARRLGGVRDSEIVDLDKVQANWRESEDFGLGWKRGELPPRDDDPTGEVKKIGPLRSSEAP